MSNTAYDGGSWTALERAPTEPDVARTRWERTGRAVHAADAAELVTWLKPGLVLTDSNAAKLRALYQLVIEMMANTASHAGRQTPWRLTVVLSKRSGEHDVVVSFCDSGCGVVGARAAHRSRRACEDAVVLQGLVHDIGRGDRATDFRGRGLHFIQRSAQRGLISTALLSSHRACADLKSGRVTTLPASRAVLGTAISFRMVLEVADE